MGELRRRSLRARLLFLAFLTIAAALVLAWLGLTIIFERHIKARLATELSNTAIWIAANLEAGAELSLSAEPTDARFDRPLGGLYWQVETPDGEPLRSRSLWDQTLAKPPEELPASYQAAGPQGTELYAHTDEFELAEAAASRKIAVTVAADHSEIDRAVGDFRTELAVALILIGSALAAAAAIQVNIGLAPLGALQREVAAVRNRHKNRLEAAVPREVGPLVDEVNDLLAAQEEALVRARAQAGDLAHGLKTPLAVLSNLAPHLTRAGYPSYASDILGQVDAMKRRIDRQLARARLGIGSFASSRADLLVNRLFSLLQRTPGGQRLTWKSSVAAGILVPADEVDVAEVLGNLLENACKWASSVVHVGSSVDGGRVSVWVEDDGPGVPTEKYGEILGRGNKLDEEVDGSGLGLSIVDDVVRAYQAELSFSTSPLGGLRVCVTWPPGPQ